MLHCIQESLRPADLIPSYHSEVIICQRNGWLDSDNILQPKSMQVLSQVDKLFKSTRKNNIKFDTEEFMTKLQEYREMFPQGKLPSGKAARTNIDELKKKMVEFFVKHPKYDWDLVLDATEDYIESYRKQNYNFMKTAGYFISKDGISDLADQCDMILEGGCLNPVKKSIYNIG